MGGFWVGYLCWDGVWGVVWWFGWWVGFGWDFSKRHSKEEEESKAADAIRCETGGTGATTRRRIQASKQAHLHDLALEVLVQLPLVVPAVVIVDVCGCEICIYMYVYICVGVCVSNMCAHPAFYALHALLEMAPHRAWRRS